MMKQNGFVIIASITMLNALYASAADLYRCGSTFQDTPCNNSSASQPYKKSITPVNKDVAASTPPNITTIDSDCKKHGDTAKKIMWKREVGRTLDEQIASPPDGASSYLIREVYKLKGSSLEVKNAIEQLCMQQKEDEKLPGNLAPKRERFSDIPPAANLRNDKTMAPQMPVTSTQASQAGDFKLERCNFIKSSLDKIENNRRTGGNAQYMESLKRDQKRLNDEYKSRGC